MRLGLFGGTFDPVHYGHLLLAECCREQCGLQEVWFLPAAQAPHKRSAPPAPAARRVEMLELAIAGNDSFRVCNLEIRRGGLSFTVDTLTQLTAERPEAEWFFLLGADSLDDLPNWRQPERICSLAVPVVVSRPGSPEPDLQRLAGMVDGARMERIRGFRVQMPQIDLRSSDIRRRVAADESIRYRTPKAVEVYIATHGLYRE